MKSTIASIACLRFRAYAWIAVGKVAALFLVLALVACTSAPEAPPVPVPGPQGEAGADGLDGRPGPRGVPGRPGGFDPSALYVAQDSAIENGLRTVYCDEGDLSLSGGCDCPYSPTQISQPKAFVDRPIGWQCWCGYEQDEWHAENEKAYAICAKVEL